MVMGLLRRPLALLAMTNGTFLKGLHPELLIILDIILVLSRMMRDLGKCHGRRSGEFQGHVYGIDATGVAPLRSGGGLSSMDILFGRD
jgi:hypothetical protein